MDELPCCARFLVCMFRFLFVTICERVSISASSDESDYVEPLSEEETSTSEDEDDNDYLQRLLSASFLCVTRDRTELTRRFTPPDGQGLLYW